MVTTEAYRKVWAAHCGKWYFRAICPYCMAREGAAYEGEPLICYQCGLVCEVVVPPDTPIIGPAMI